MIRAFFIMLLCAASAWTSLPATAEGNSPALESDEPLFLVVHTAEDCPFCKIWRESDSGLAVAKQLPQTWPLLQVVIVERKSIHANESESLYPRSLQFLYEARRERYQLAPATPMFEIVRRGQVIYRRSGLPGWTDGILPTLKELEASRVAASASSQAPVPQQ